MTNLENTIPELQELLELANALPEEGGSSGGTEVKTASGSLTTNTNGSATVSCGFRPDVVVVKNFCSSWEEEYSVCCCFPERSYSSYSLIATGYSLTYNATVYVTFTRGTSNFGVSMYYYNTSGSQVKVNNGTFEYTAIKYTA